VGKIKQKIFIVHGHDKASKEALARIIENNGFEAIVLNERLNKGMTIILAIGVQT
jgi:predicted nucleotide-binding protein